MSAEIISASKVEERRRRMAENGRLMDERWAKLEEEHTVNFLAAMGRNPDGSDIEEEIEVDLPLERHVPTRYPAKGPRSIVVKWFRSSSSPEAFHSFRMSYPVGMTEEVDEQIQAALKAADWRNDDLPYWRPGSGSGGGAYWYDGTLSGGAEFEQVDEILRTVVKDVFHIGDAPSGLAQVIIMRWNERTPQDYVRCTIDEDKLPPLRLEQLRSVIDRFDGFKSGQSITFPQIHSGDIVADLQMAGFSVVENFSDDEPHYIEISESAPIWIRGMIGQDEWIFQTRGDFWEIRIGGADPAIWPKWSYGDVYGDTSFSAASMPFNEAELLIAAAIQRYRSGGAEQPLQGA